LVSFKEENDKICCVGKFMGNIKEHLVKFTALKKDANIEINLDNIKESIRKAEEEEKKDIEIGDVEEIAKDFIEKNKDKLKKLADKMKEIIEKNEDEKKFESFIDDSGFDTYVKNFLKMCFKEKSITEEDVKRFIADYIKYVDESTLDDILDYLDKFKVENSFTYFKRELLYHLKLDDGTFRTVKACVLYKKNLDEDNSILIFEDENGKEDEELNAYYALDKNIKRDVIEKIKKSASGTMTPSLGNMPQIFRLNSAFLPANLEVGDVIVVDGMHLKLVDKNENVISDTKGDHGSYWVFEQVFDVIPNTKPEIKLNTL
jgi:hypothetical protein